MASRYTPNRWALYDPSISDEDQPDSFITQRKLERMEEGIEDANIDIEAGTLTIGNEYHVEVVLNPVENTKKLNITLPPGTSAGSGNGLPGKDGKDGEDGESAYEIWLAQGNEGTEQEFLESLKGADGEDGKDGQPGKDGEVGPKGESAYQVWIAEGNSGSVDDFLNSLKGVPGMSAFEIWQTIPGNENKTITDFFEYLKGEPGEPGTGGGNSGLEFVDFGIEY